MKKITLTILIIFLSLSIDGKKYGSSINWLKGTISSRGFAGLNISQNGQPVNEFGETISINRGRTLAYREAEMHAREYLMRELKRLHIDSSNTINSMLSNQIARQKLSRIITLETRVKLYPVNFMQSGCKIDLTLKSLIKAIPTQFPQDDFPLRDDIEISTDYTSLIIDTRELKIKPMIFPSVYNESGLEVYSKLFIDPAYILNSGIVSYVFTEKAAYKHKNAGTSPFLTAALKNLKGSPVIANDVIKKVYSSKNTLQYLKKCRVIFIIDRS